MCWLLVWAIAPGFAQDLQRWFPERALTTDDARAVLTRDVLGAPATDYSTATGGASDSRDHRILARARSVEPDALEVPDGLQRYAQAVLTLNRRGQPLDSHRWFVAEHVGLALAPRTVGTFVVAGDDDAVSVVKQVVARLVDVPVAVATTEVDVGLAGIVVALDASVRLDPLPRSVEPGATLTLTGSQSTKVPTSLWVASDAGSQALALQGASFDVSWTAPDVRGPVRMALGPTDARRLPPSSFFFTVYVGQSPPGALPAATERPKAGTPVAKFERKLLDAIDAARKDRSRAPLVRGVLSDALLKTVQEVEPGDRTLVPRLKRPLKADPLPRTAHGSWGAMLLRDGLDGASAARFLLSHPAWGPRLLAADTGHVLLHTRTDPAGRFESLAVTVNAPPSEPLRDRAFAEVASRWPGAAEPLPAPKLEAALTELATLRAAGQISKSDFDNRLGIVLLSTKIVPGRASAYSLLIRPGETLDLSELKLTSELVHLAVGAARGEEGTTRSSYEFVVVVASDRAY